MKDEEKTKKQLIDELRDLKKGIAELEASKTDINSAEEVLLNRKNKYKTLIENLPQKIFYKDKKSVYVSCNSNYARDLKISPDEIHGKTDYDFYPIELAEKYIADDKRIMKSGSSKTLDETYTQDGKEIVVRTVKTPVRNDKGNIDKNTSYWQMVANVADQPAFMNEIHDLEKKYIDAIEQSLMMEDTYKHTAGFQSTLYGIREVRKIITDGINKTRGDHA